MVTILLDHEFPHRLRQFLVQHDVETAFYRGWSNLANGELLAAAKAAGFDSIVTADRNLRFKQYPASFPARLADRREQQLAARPAQRGCDRSRWVPHRFGRFHQVAFDVPD